MECARALAEVGYDGWLTLETPSALPPVIGRDLSFTRSAFAVDADGAWPRFGAFSYDHEAGEWERLASDFDRLGLEAVQLGTGLLDECLEDADSAAMRRGYLEDHGIRVAALAGYRNLVSPDGGVRAANIDYLRRCLEVAPTLGTFVVATETGTRDPTGDWTDSPENWATRRGGCSTTRSSICSPAAEESGAILALEAHVKNVLKTQGQALELLDRFPSRSLQLVCDPYNYLSRHLLPGQRRATAELLDRFEERFVVAHLKDVARSAPKPEAPRSARAPLTRRRTSDSWRTPARLR